MMGAVVTARAGRSMSFACPVSDAIEPHADDGRPVPILSVCDRHEPMIVCPPAPMERPSKARATIIQFPVVGGRIRAAGSLATTEMLSRRRLPAPRDDHPVSRRRRPDPRSGVACDNQNGLPSQAAGSA
jgi:hypothetical protein